MHRKYLGMPAVKVFFAFPFFFYFPALPSFYRLSLWGPVLKVGNFLEFGIECVGFHAFLRLLIRLIFILFMHAFQKFSIFSEFYSYQKQLK